MSSKKTYLALLLLPIFALVLSGCGKETEEVKTPSRNATQSAPQASATDQNQTLKDNAQQASQAPATLEPLPADNKQAIDSEISNIDKDLKSTTIDTSASDLSNTNLGL